MTVRRTKKPPKQKAIRQEIDDSDKRPCVTCGTVRKTGAFRFSMPSLLDPTLYACDIPCFDTWQKKQDLSATPKFEAAVRAKR